METRSAQAQGGSGAVFNAAEEAAKRCVSQFTPAHHFGDLKSHACAHMAIRMCREKYDELVAKERDLNNFMDSFPSRRAEKTREAQEKQDAIVALLDKIAKLQGLVGSALPSQKKFKEMQVGGRIDIAQIKSELFFS